MEEGFKNNEFVVYLQPKVDLNKREITAAEALIRWRRLDGTFIYPNEFIPVFEKNKIESVFERAFKILCLSKKA